MIPLLLVMGVLLYGAVKRAPVYTAFVEGAEQGLRTAVQVVPYLAAALLLIGVLRGSGVLDALGACLLPVLELAGVPKELLMLLIVRPLSGSAALSALQEVIATCGVDSYPARAAACALGSSETVVYTVALYLGSIKVRASRYILPIGLVSGFIGTIFACFFCKFL